jgi:uncharacterized FlaG/YvyC family protein
MPIEDRNNPDGWTLRTLYIHVMEISKAAKEGVNAAMASAEKAILKAETANEKRFDSVNEFRQAMKDREEKFAVKAEVDLRLDDLAKRVDRIATGMELSVGKTSGVVTVAIGAAWFITTAIAVLAIFLRH